MAFPSIPALSSSSASSPSTGPSGNSSSTTSLVLTAIVSGAVSAGITYWIQTRKRKKRIQRIKTEINEGIKKSASSSSIQSFTTPGNYSTATSERNLLEESFVNAQSNPIPLLRSMTDSTSSSSSSSSSAASTMAPSEELTREQLARNYSFLGEEKMNKVRKSFVVVVGTGGVGSHAAHMLLRSGVEHIRLIDFDQVSLSSLNRHAVATQSDVGTPKVLAMKKHFKAIFPNAFIDIRNEMFEKPRAQELLLSGGVRPDYVLDCIDNMQTKIDLIQFCVENELPIVSSMGAGAKCDPSRVQIADISDTNEDALARTTRRRLRLLGIESGVDVVYSTEKPGEVKLLDLDNAQLKDADEYAPLEGFRVRILPVLGTLPAMFGLAMATYVITKLADWPIRPLAVKLREKTYRKIWVEMLNRETHIFNTPATENRLTEKDIGYIFEEMFQGKSFLSGKLTDRIFLTRWDNTKQVSFDNVICLTREEAKIHDSVPPEKLEETYGREFCERLRKRLDEEKKLLKWRY